MTVVHPSMLAYDCMPGSDPSWLGVVLHGLGDSRRGWPPVIEQIGEHRPTWCYLEAPIPYFEGFSWFAIPGMTGPDDGPDELTRDLQRSREALATTIDALLAEHGLPPERLLLLGFSQGCVMALDHLLRADHRYAGLLALSGWLAEAERYPDQFGAAAFDQHIYWSHGRYDPLLPIDATREQARRLREAGLQIDWHEYDAEHGATMGQLADLRAWLAARIDGADDAG